MKKVYIVYSCDVWHTYESRRLQGVFEDKEWAIQQLRKKYNLTDHNVYLLQTIGQTQGIGGHDDAYDGEFIIDEEILNTLED